MSETGTPPGRAPDIVEELGPLALASRLKRLHERLARDAAQVYTDLGFRFQPRWFLPVYCLHRHGPASVTELAASLGLSHPAINQAAAELAEAGWLTGARHRTDDRKRMLKLTRQGKTLALRLEPVWEEIRRATVGLFLEAGADPLAQLAAVEHALNRLSIYDRVRKARGDRLELPTDIVDYQPRFKKHFDSLNRAWLTEYFHVEPEDERLLSDPKGTIINRGGAVLFALQGERIVGTCALIRHAPGDFELAKMAVDPSARRQGIGRKLVEAIVERARASGGKHLFLLSSEKLQAALALYRETGFSPAPLPRELAAKYERCTVAMDFNLGASPQPQKRKTKSA
jgi:GNAT superfamily N-acetyltransferase/DNA-binding MarR family transcriptional regulator